MAVTNTVNVSLLAKHGLSRGCRHQSQVLLLKNLIFYYPAVKLISEYFCVALKGTLQCCFPVYLQTDCPCYFLHQAIIDGRVDSALPADGAGEHLSDVYP